MEQYHSCVAAGVDESCDKRPEFDPRFHWQTSSASAPLRSQPGQFSEFATRKLRETNSLRGTRRRLMCGHLRHLLLKKFDKHLARFIALRRHGMRSSNVRDWS